MLVKIDNKLHLLEDIQLIMFSYDQIYRKTTIFFWKRKGKHHDVLTEIQQGADLANAKNKAYSRIGTITGIKPNPLRNCYGGLWLSEEYMVAMLQRIEGNKTSILLLKQPEVGGSVVKHESIVDIQHYEEKDIEQIALACDLQKVGDSTWLSRNVCYFDPENSLVQFDMNGARSEAVKYHEKINAQKLDDIAHGLNPPSSR